MNYKNMRGTPRPTLSLRYGARHSQAAGEHLPDAATIPLPELRRLVAQMVD